MGRLAVLGLCRGEGLAGDFQAILDQYLIETEQRLALANLLVGLHVEHVDDAFQRRANHSRAGRHQFAGRQHGQPHGNQCGYQ